MSRKKVANSEKILTPLGERLAHLEYTMGLKGSSLAKKIGITSGYLSELKYTETKQGGKKFWQGVRENLPEWGAYLRRETDTPPQTKGAPDKDGVQSLDNQDEVDYSPSSFLNDATEEITLSRDLLKEYPPLKHLIIALTDGHIDIAKDMCTKLGHILDPQSGAAHGKKSA